MIVAQRRAKARGDDEGDATRRSARGIGNPQSCEVYLIFTKTDSVVKVYTMESNLIELRDSTLGSHADKITKLDEIKNGIKSTGGIDNLTLTPFPKGDEVQSIERDNSVVFADLIAFFRSRIRRFAIIYSSMTVADAHGERMGVRKVLEGCLP